MSHLSTTVLLHPDSLDSWDITIIKTKIKCSLHFDVQSEESVFFFSLHVPKSGVSDTRLTFCVSSLFLWAFVKWFVFKFCCWFYSSCNLILLYFLLVSFITPFQRSLFVFCLLLEVIHHQVILGLWFCVSRLVTIYFSVYWVVVIPSHLQVLSCILYRFFMAFVIWVVE